MSIEKEANEIKLVYNEISKKITLQTYDEGFFNQEIDITNAVMELAVEKLFDDMNCPVNGGVVQLTRKNNKRNGVVKVIGKLL